MVGGSILNYTRCSLFRCKQLLEVTVVEEFEHLALGRLETGGVCDRVLELVCCLDVLLVHFQVDCGLIC